MTIQSLPQDPVTVGQEIPAPTLPAAMSYRIKRIGGRALSFSGAELGMAMNYTPGAGSWYEINIYRTQSQTFVLSIRLFFSSEDEIDTVRAWEFDTFEEVMAKLESYDAGDDVRVTVYADDPDLSLPELSAHAFTLRARAEVARRDFRALVGEILFDLESS